MLFKLKKPVTAYQISEILGIKYSGRNVEIENISSLSYMKESCLAFSIDSVSDISEYNLVIGASRDSLSDNYLSSNRPRLDFIRVLGWLKKNDYLQKRECGKVHNDACIHPNSIVDKGAQIGRGCMVGPFSYIGSNVVMGENICIGSSVSIGHEGFGYERDENDIPIHFPHLADVIIESEVVIGNNCTLSCGNLENTHIASHVKIDDHVYIAHNVQIGMKTMIMSGVHCNGSVRIGEKCWVGTGALIREGITVESESIIGMGSVVINNVTAGETVYGNPARSRGI